MENGQMGQINGEMYATAKMWFDLWKKSNRLSFRMCDSVRVWGQKTNRGEAHLQMWMHRCSFCLTQLFSIIHKYLSPAKLWCQGIFHVWNCRCDPCRANCMKMFLLNVFSSISWARLCVFIQYHQDCWSCGSSPPAIIWLASDISHLPFIDWERKLLISRWATVKQIVTHFLVSFNKGIKDACSTVDIFNVV